MSQLRLVKPLVFKSVLRQTNVRMFSSWDEPTIYPFLLIDYLINIKDGQRNDLVTKWYEKSLPNGCKQKGILIRDEKLRDDVCDGMSFGSSRLKGDKISHSTKFNNGGDESLKGFLIEHKPSNPEIKDVKISLPSLPSGSKLQGIAMSSLPVRDKDWAVGVKLEGFRLSLCRPFGNRKWIEIEAMPEFISPFSSIMFSKKDKKFYIPSPGGKRLCSLDLHFKEEDKPEFIYIELDNLPKSAVDELEDVSLCSRTDHLVESPRGDHFLVKCYYEDVDESYLGSSMSSLMHKTKRFMVFRGEGWGSSYGKNMIYTEDIGDLCIFLGHGEALCVPASSSPGLRPNCIYFEGYNFGVYDLTTKTCTTFFDGIDKKDGKESLLRGEGLLNWPLPIPLE